MPKEKIIPESCCLPKDRLEELQIYKFLQAVRAEDFHLITELTIEGVPNLVNLCEPRHGVFPLLLAVELRKIDVIEKLFALGCDGNTGNINGKTATMAAAQLGAVEILNKLIGYGCDLSQVDNSEWDTLCYCLVDQTEEHFSCLQRCLEEDEKVFSNSLAIILALEKAEMGLVASRAILDKLKNPNIIHRINKKSALSYAAEFNPMLVKDFLTSGADVTSKDIKGNTAVHYAAKSGSADALESLSGFKADFNALNADGQNCFHIACNEGKSKIVKYLVQRGAHPKIKDKKQMTGRALSNKKTLKEVKKAERVWSKRQNVNKVAFRDWLHTMELEVNTFVNMTEIDRDLLVQILTEQLKPPCSNDEVAEFIDLIAKGSSDVKVKDLWKPGKLVPKLYETPGKKKKKKKKKGKGKKGKKSKPSKGNVPICVEPRNQHRRADGGPPHDLIERLRLNTDLERFGRENRPKHPFQDDSAWYLRFPSRDFERLNSTIKNGDMTSLKYAFDHGYPVDTQDRFYKTALMHAASAGQVDTVKFLLANGANVNVTDNMKWTALHHAVTSGGVEVSKLLVENGADINAKTFNSATVLMRAVQGSDSKVVSFLLENGAGGKKIFAENKKGKTVMDIAEQWTDLETFRILKEHFDKVPPPKDKRGGPKKKPKEKTKVEKPKVEETSEVVQQSNIILAPLPGKDEVARGLSGKHPLSSASQTSKNIFAVNNSHWASAPHTAQLLQRRKDVRMTPIIIQNVHRIWAKNSIMPKVEV